MTIRPRRSRSRAPLALAAAALAAMAALPGCSSGDKPRPKAVSVQPVIRDIPAPLRGTLGAEATLRGLESILISGIGLVVGLNGTGGGELPERVSATMERELALRGIGKSSSALAGTPLEGLTPRQVLSHPDVAVVVVYAAIPPAAPEGMPFDVYVQALNDGGMVSLEGGTLWTTDLRLGPPAAFGSFATRLVGKARGPIFVNPFAEPGTDDGLTGRIGRILYGGVVTDSREFDLILDNPSYGRARTIVSTINTRFPEGPGDRGKTAIGRNDSLINIRVPAMYTEDPETFVNLLRYTRTDPSLPQEHAQNYIAALKEQPGLADELSWALRALGKPAIPFLRPLYEDPEIGPRMAALRAGAGLGDARAAEPLKELATSGPPTVRTEAIALLAKLDAGPTVDLALRDLLSVSELDVRVAAYEGLARRAEAVQMARLAAYRAAQPTAARIATPDADLHLRAMMQFPGGTIQGVARRPVEGKFLLDVVPAGEPLVYVTQQGRPRIVLFGEQLTLTRPTLVSIWSDRLMLAADTSDDDIRLYYRPLRGGKAIQSRIGPSVAEFVEFLAHTPSPEDPRPGLGLTYSEVVGALYAIHQAGGIDAAFATERDRLLAELLKANQETFQQERPETPRDRPDLEVFQAPVPKPGDAPAPKSDTPPLVVPLDPRPPGEKPKE